ncbi:hypothetical protein AAMO2058_000151800 [Amorphochlora amoebiformis]
MAPQPSIGCLTVVWVLLIPPHLADPVKGGINRARGGTQRGGRGRTTSSGRIPRQLVYRHRMNSKPYEYSSPGLIALKRVSQFREAQKNKTVNKAKLLQMLNDAIGAAGKAGISRTAQQMLINALEPDTGIQPNLGLFHSALESLPKENILSGVSTILCLIEASGLSPNSKTYSIAIHRLAEGGEWAKALEYLEIVEKREVTVLRDRLKKPNKKVFSMVTAGLIGAIAASAQTARAWETALSLVRRAEAYNMNKTSTLYTVEAAALSHSSRPAASLKVLNMAGHSGIRRSLSLIHAAMHACSRNAWWEKSYGLLRHASNSHYRINGGTYANLISSYLRNAQWSQALSALRAMDREDIPKWDERAVDAANIAIKVCIKGRSPSRGIWIMDRWMQRAGVRPNCNTLNLALIAYGKMGGWREAISIAILRFNELKLRRNVETFTSLASALINGKRWEGAVHAISSMLDSQLRHNLHSYATLIEIKRNSGKWQEALSVWNAIQQHHKGGERLSQCLAKCLDALSTANQTQRALDIFESEKPKDYVQLNVYAAALRACAST